MTDDSRYLSDEVWALVTANLPIACVDVFPVVCTPDGSVAHIGLIRRHLAGKSVWCHLGGRLLFGESLREGALRHLDETLVLDSSGADRSPKLAETEFTVHEYFPTPRDGFGMDPSKQAVAVCYKAEFSAPWDLTAQGEACEFAWFAVDAIPEADAMWPGSWDVIQRLVPTQGYRDEKTTYEAINDRYISHNEMMWQTPVLAMTAMAFLMTISLGDGANWRRAVAAMLSAVTAFVSVQLMVKHSRNQIADADLLHQLERCLGMRPVHAPPAPTRPQTPRGSWPGRLITRAENRLVAYRSRHWWLVALSLFGLVSFAIGTLALLGI